MAGRASGCNDHLNNIIEKLKASPLFHLSLASKELFHSNFLAWLCECYPQEGGSLFAGYLPTPLAAITELRVYRERRNVDLTLEYANGQTLIVENKVKSLPKRAQFEEYAADFPDRSSTGLLLLTLTQPTFQDRNSPTGTLKDGAVWHIMLYHDLAERLRTIQPIIHAGNGYHGELVADYIDFVSCLDELQALFEINWDDDTADFFNPDYDLERLRDIRLHDLIAKLRYARLASQVAEVLAQRGLRAVDGPLHDGCAGDVLTDFGLTNGTGLFDFKYVVLDKALLGNPVLLGVQLQGHSFRLVAELWDKARSRPIAEALLKTNGPQLWFDLSHIDAGSVEYPRRRDFNQYGGTFWYRYRNISAMTPRKLVELIVSYAEYIQANEDRIRERVLEAVAAVPAT